jgi:coenzyme Q-binding protein COQ10
LPDTSEQLVDLVADIARYLEFLPWCVGARIPARAGNRVKADLAIGFTVKDSASVV